MSDFRNCGGYVRPFLTFKPIMNMYTSNPIDKELWLLLKSKYQIRRICNNFIRQRRNLAGNRLSSICDEFSAFLKQAENYFNAASTLPWNSSPLLYYYSFLNLAKAIIILYHDLPSNATHGLSYHARSGWFALKKQIIVSNNNTNGIFPLLYNTITGRAINSTNLPINQLLSYITDIQMQYNTLKLGISRNIPCLCAIGEHLRQRAWLIFMVPKPLKLEYRWPFSQQFRRDFELVEVNDRNIHIAYHQIGQIFNLSVPEVGGFNIYQSRNEHPWLPNGKRPTQQLFDSLMRSLGPYIEEKCFPGDFDLKLNLPFRITGHSGWILMNEFLSSYAIMFYLGMLVRYHPEILDKIENRKEKWLFESFVMSIRNSFLRRVVSHIFNAMVILKRIE